MTAIDIPAEDSLANLIYRETFTQRGRQIFKPAFREALRSARRFVLTPEMSAYLADLGWGAFKSERNANKRAGIFDHMRELSRLPHRSTWVEWDEIALATRARSEYDSQLNPDLVPRRSGFLMMQYETDETKFRCIGCGIGGLIDGLPRYLQDKRDDQVGLTPMAITWSVDDSPVVWKNLPVVEKVQREHGFEIGEILSGVQHYDGKGRIGFASCADLMNSAMPDDEMARMLREQAGMLRYLFGFLATINDTPVEMRTARASKGFVGKGSYRKFLDHTVIGITVPTSRYAVVARKVLTNLRKRAHMVRGHWREDWRNPGKKIWIREHQRGDASLGFVVHDYSVDIKKEKA